MMGSIFSAMIQVIMEGKLSAGTADSLPRIIGEIVLVVCTVLLTHDFCIAPATKTAGCQCCCREAE
jgi:hypothetical protein